MKNEPAFPIPSVGTGDPRDGMTTGHTGMSLRDWFAGQALAGAWANPDLSKAMSEAGMRPHDVRLSLAESAYAQADIMLKARESNPTNEHEK